MKPIYIATTLIKVPTRFLYIHGKRKKFFLTVTYATKCKCQKVIFLEIIYSYLD